MFILKRRAKNDRRAKARLRLIVNLGRRRDRLLESPELDLHALARLVAAYESAGLPRAAAALRRRLERDRGQKKSNPPGQLNG
jgi:hypothetical protein